MANTNSLELTIGTTHSKSSSVSATTISPQSSSPNEARFSCPKSIPKGQQSLDQRNSILAASPTITTTSMKASKQPKKRRRSSEQASPIVTAPKNNDVLVSPIPVDGLKDMPQPFVSPLPDMGFHVGTIPTTISALHQPANHQIQDVKNCFGNVYDSEQHPAQLYNRSSHKNVPPEENLNSMFNKVCVPQHNMMCVHVYRIFCRWYSNSSHRLHYSCRSTSCLMACWLDPLGVV